ncbi:hypothetical protein COCOBI_pt-1790 (chloroplast) [Coccomyxa sp. Obi]|nr:hypothetical protein COCOBI_pt-1790 [Coccomyxa sp. Obi]
MLKPLQTCYYYCSQLVEPLELVAMVSPRSHPLLANYFRLKTGDSRTLAYRVTSQATLLEVNDLHADQGLGGCLCVACKQQIDP